MKYLIATFLLISTLGTISAQGVGVGTNEPHQSAVFHMQSTDQGVLIPRMLENQRNDINHQAHPLLAASAVEVSNRCITLFFSD